MRGNLALAAVILAVSAALCPVYFLIDGFDLGDYLVMVAVTAGAGWVIQVVHAAYIAIRMWRARRTYEKLTGRE